MFRRLQTDRVTELKQITEFVRLLRIIYFNNYKMIKQEKQKILSKLYNNEK